MINHHFLSSSNSNFTLDFNFLFCALNIQNFFLKLSSSLFHSNSAFEFYGICCYFFFLLFLASTSFTFLLEFVKYFPNNKKTKYYYYYNKKKNHLQYGLRNCAKNIYGIMKTSTDCGYGFKNVCSIIICTYQDSRLQ